MDEANLNSNQWKYCYHTKPIENILLLVFRDKNKKYIIAQAKLSKDEYGNEELKWVTQQGNVHSIQDDDLYMEFEHVRQEVLYN